mmetsp:Transcript_19788/g.36120  ORF Transcript_19788/g.36120 Transcript_19788/m.36120 type:complete len:630 (+) Transcript_19788:56-1945(+)
MQKISLVFTWLACTGHGQHAQFPEEHLERRANRGNFHPLRKLASFLLVLKPAAFRPAMGPRIAAGLSNGALALIRGRCLYSVTASAGAARGAGTGTRGRRRSFGRGWSPAPVEGGKASYGSHLPEKFDFEGPIARLKERTGFSVSEELDSRLREVGSCMHLKSAVSSEDDFRLLDALAEDVEKAGYHEAGDALGLHRSKKHLQIWGDALAGSPVFAALVTRVLDMFDLTLVDCWANLYRGGNDMKAFHHDNYQHRSPRPTVTIGVSLGQSRELSFLNAVTKEEVRLLQRNGDIFAFDEPFNNLFKHGVPAGKGGLKSGKRLSVIIWANENDSLNQVVRAGKSVQRDIIPLEVLWDKWPTLGYGELSRQDRRLNGKGTSESIEAALRVSSNGSDPRLHVASEELYPEKLASEELDVASAELDVASKAPDFIEVVSEEVDVARDDPKTEVASEELDLQELRKPARDDPAVLQVQRALTLQGAQQVLSILRGYKLIENRGWKIPVGWYAIHAGGKHINEERAQRVRQVWPDAPKEKSLPHGAIYGLFYVQTHRTPQQCRPDYIWARGPTCHIISKTVEFPSPIKSRGDKGLWELTPTQLEQIREQLQGEVPIKSFDFGAIMNTRPKYSPVGK